MKAFIIITVFYISICCVLGQNASSTTEAPMVNVTTMVANTTTEMANTTTEMANTTTEMANTTTEMANITTEMANTTTEMANTTTEMANTTTEMANTTVMVTTTTAAMTTTAMPRPPVDKYTYTIVGSDNKTCLIAQMMITLKYQYEGSDNQTKMVTMDLFDPLYNVMTQGQCANNTMMSMLNLSIAKQAENAEAGWLSLTFTENEKTKMVNISKVEFFAVLQDGKEPNITISNPDFKFNLSTSDKYFVCATPQERTVADNVNLTLAEIKVQAFNVKGDFANESTECADDVVTTAMSLTTAATFGPTTPLPATPPTIDVTVTQEGSNVSCIVGTIGVRFSIKYKKNGVKDMVSQQFDIPPKENGTEIFGDCGNNSDTQVLNVTFLDNWSYIIEFTKTSKQYSASKMELYYQLDEHFENPDQQGARFANGTTNAFKADVGNYYLCNHKEHYTFGDVTIDTTNVKLQAFTNSDNKNVKGNAQECSDDDKTSDIVPIAVGAALAGLVVIVLIAYLIGRKRNHSGYQSV